MADAQIVVDDVQSMVCGRRNLEAPNSWLPDTMKKKSSIVSTYGALNPCRF